MTKITITDSSGAILLQESVASLPLASTFADVTIGTSYTLTVEDEEVTDVTEDVAAVDAPVEDAAVASVDADVEDAEAETVADATDAEATPTVA